MIIHQSFTQWLAFKFSLMFNILVFFLQSHYLVISQTTYHLVQSQTPTAPTASGAVGV